MFLAYLILSASLFVRLVSARLFAAQLWKIQAAVQNLQKRYDSGPEG